MCRGFCLVNIYFVHFPPNELHSKVSCKVSYLQVTYFLDSRCQVGNNYHLNGGNDGLGVQGYLVVVLGQPAP